MRLIADRIFSGRPWPLKNNGILDFIDQFAADEFSHRLAFGEYRKPIATLAEPDCLAHAALADDCGLPRIVEHIAIDIDPEFLLEISFLQNRPRLAPAHRCGVLRNALSFFRLESKRASAPTFRLSRHIIGIHAST
jgi:hypothetical protein